MRKANNGLRTQHQRLIPRRLKKGMPDIVRSWAKRMRTNPTPAEAALFAACKQFGIQVLSQVPFGNELIGQRIADVYIPKLRLCLEADGFQHYTPEGIASDKERGEFFAAHYPQVRLIRYRNHEILEAGFIDRLRIDIANINTAMPAPFTSAPAVSVAVPPLSSPA